MGKENRHAYCIIAHTDLYCLKKLIQCIDDSRNDIYIHLDKKSSLDLSTIKTQHSSLYILPEEYRHSVKWGTYSQVEAEMDILEYAYNNGKYEFFHLISGQDLPLHNQDYIHNYFNSLPRGTNLIGFKDYSWLDWINVRKRIVPFHFFKNNYRHKRKIIQYSSRIFEEIANHFQILLGLKINRNIIYRKGCNWASIHADFVAYIINNRDFVDSILRKSIINDELLLQTLIWNSNYKDTVKDYYDEYKGCMREIDWSRGNPYTWRVEDYNQLISSKKLFARKFSSAEDKEIIDKIVCHVTKQA